jgi:hypothetical protein
LPPLRVLFEDLLEREQLLGNALRVIEPIDPHEDLLARVRALQGGELLSRGPALEHLPHLSGIDADRLDRQAHAPRADAHGFHVRLDAEHTQARAPEVVGVLVGVEPEQIGAQHALQDRFADGQRAVRLRRRKRDVQKEADRARQTAPPQQRRDESELVVVHPDHVTRLGLSGDRLGEHLVDDLVRLPTGEVEAGALGEVVEQRPQHTVREALVEPLHVRLADVHGVRPSPLERARHLGAVLFRNIGARPAEPGE